MTDKVLLVTSPDDTPIDAIRILLIDLDPSQSQLVSDAVNKFSSIPNLVFYIWKSGDPIDWLVDKKHKSHSIFFNANSDNDLVLGYIIAQLNSHYFGILKSFRQVNNNAIYTVDDIVNIIENLIIRYE